MLFPKTLLVVFKSLLGKVKDPKEEKSIWKFKKEYVISDASYKVSVTFFIINK